MKANTLSLITKCLAALMVLISLIVVLTGRPVDMVAIISGAAFLSASFLPVDISKIKQA
jgi:hypothetical protein